MAIKLDPATLVDLEAATSETFTALTQNASNTYWIVLKTGEDYRALTAEEVRRGVEQLRQLAASQTLKIAFANTDPYTTDVKDVGEIQARFEELAPPRRRLIVFKHGDNDVQVAYEPTLGSSIVNIGGLFDAGDLVLPGESASTYRSSLDAGDLHLTGEPGDNVCVRHQFTHYPGISICKICGRKCTHPLDHQEKGHCKLCGAQI